MVKVGRALGLCSEEQQQREGVHTRAATHARVACVLLHHRRASQPASMSQRKQWHNTHYSILYAPCAAECDVSSARCSVFVPFSGWLLNATCEDCQCSIDMHTTPHRSR